MGEESELQRRFSELLETYAAPMRRLCAAYAPHAADREDLFQDICFAIWRALPQYRGQASIRTWMYRIAHNVALTWQSRTRRRASRETSITAEMTATEPSHLRRLALVRAVAALPPMDRALTLLWLEGLTAHEIEDVTGLRSATVAVRLSRIRKQLQPEEITR
ncbi:MAG TPA: RNA polymerase sigma factor [Vicinamibacterales bacterium]|nr:RNA polymerase sigma factor [Vicinamibacterales bacterium]